MVVETGQENITNKKVSGPNKKQQQEYFTNNSVYQTSVGKRSEYKEAS